MVFLCIRPAPSGVNNNPTMVVSPGDSAARRLACLLQVLALLLILCGSAQARTARITLTVNGDEGMSEDLKQLVEEFQKNQPLQGDGLALLQGAQAALARVNTALRSRGFYDARATAIIDNRSVCEPQIGRAACRER